ncbi:MAG: S8 family serine peptidase [Endomicrobium sp.]|jgi:subtilisin family serine protease|nr:S8 family serine peptidase [Endomicrobium sp.]
MIKVLFKTLGISFIISIFLSYASAAIITERLESALIKEQNNSVVSAFGDEREVSKFEEEVVVIIHSPEDNSFDNIDKSFISFLEVNGIPYSLSKSSLEICIYPNKMGQNKIKELKDKIEKLSDRYRADRSYPAQPMEIISEGRNAINASKFVLDGIDGKYHDGTHVKIAVIDEGFKGCEELQRRGELPQNLRWYNAAAGNYTEDDHGSKCGEIISDIAPGVEMHLIKVRLRTDFDKAINYCVSNNIKIISCSIGFSDFFSFIAGMDLLDQRIDTEISNNRFLLIASAGNEAKHSWFGSFSNPSGTGGYTRFPSGNDSLNVTLPPDTNVTLIWNDYDPSTSRYRIEVYDQQNNLIQQSNFVATGRVLKSALNNKLGPGKFKIKIFKENDSMSQGREMRLIFDKGLLSGDIIDNPSDRNPESSLVVPADARNVLTVGAVDVAKYTRGPIEHYSSRGPTRPFGAYGVARKPDITAPSVVSTASGGYRQFGGTSAAVPHVAGAAALLLSLNPNLTMMELKSIVIEYAQQIQSSPDNIYGNGILVLDTNLIPPNDVGDFVCYPNPVSIGATGYVKITNLPFNTDLIDVQVYTVTGEFVKSFNVGDMFEEEYTSGTRRRMLKWDLRNQDGVRIAPGVYFVTLKTLLGNKQVKKIAVQM